MRPVYLNSGAITSSTFYFPIIVPDTMLTPGNATWIVRIGTQGSGTVSLYFTNEDIFATNFVGPNPNGTYPSFSSRDWVQEQAAFQNATGAAVASIALSSSGTLSTVGAYSFLPRGMMFAMGGCTGSPNISVDFVQSSGGRA